MIQRAKRFVALAAGVLIGVFGVALIASPAQAHHPMIEGTAVCQANGQFKITWVVSNGHWSHPKAKLLEVEASPSTPVSEIAAGVWLDPDASVTGTQFVPGDTTAATLRVKAQWYSENGEASNVIAERTGQAAGLGQKCETEKTPSATFVSACDGSVNVHIVNPRSTSATFTVTGVDGTITVAGNGQKDVTVPAGTAGPIVVKKGETKIDEYAGWARPKECPGPAPVGESTCAKFTIAVANPEGGRSTEAKITYGTQVKSVTVAPGTTQTVELNPSSETAATVEFAGWAGSTTVPYEKPGNCNELPRTGDNIGTYVAFGGGLLALGAALVFLARRRVLRARYDL